MSRLAIVVLAWLLSACAHEPPAVSAPPAPRAVPPVPVAPAPASTAVLAPPAPDAAEKFALVRFGVPLYSKPSVDAMVQSPRAETYDSYEPFRFVSEHGDFVEVESLGDDGFEHCNYASSFDGLRVRLFVARSDLEPAIARAVTVSFANGTSVSLAPGVAVGAATTNGREQRAISADGFNFLLELPPGAVAMTYARGTPFPVAEQPSHVRRDAPMLFGDGLGPGVRPSVPAAPESQVSMISSGGPRAPLVPGVIEHPEGNTYVYAASDHPAGRRVELRSRCARLELVVAPDAVVTGALPGAVSLERTPPRRIDPDRWRAPSGAAMYWPDGSAAGSVAREMPLRGEGEVRGERRCFRSVRGDFNYWAGSPDKPTLTLCFDKDRLLLWPEHMTDSVAATIGPDTRRYLVATAINHTKSSNAEILAAVRASLQNELMLGPGYAIAPPSEPKAQSERVVAERKLAGFRIEVEVPSLRRSVGKKLPNGSEQSGVAEVRPKLRLYRFPSGELLDQTELSLSRSVWLGQSVSDGEVLKESLLGAWSRFRTKMEQP